MSLTKAQRAYSNQWAKTPKGREQHRKDCRNYRARRRGELVIHNAIVRVNRKDFLNSLKNKPCFDCQGWFEPCQMDFDHRPGAIKTDDVCRLYMGSRQKLYEEIKKCDLICANCHRLRTFIRLKNRRGTE